MGNQNQYIKEEQTTQWQKEKVQKNKQRSIKHNRLLFICVFYIMRRVFIYIVIFHLYLIMLMMSAIYICPRTIIKKGHR